MKYVVLCLLLVLVAGCGGDPQPTVSTTTPTVSPPTTTAPAVETPQEFLRRWVRAMDTMERTGRPGPWEALNLKSCKDCATVAGTVRGFYAKGLRVIGSRSRVKAISSAGRGKWRIELSTHATQIVDAHGRHHGKFPGGLVTAVVRVVDVHGHHRVAAYYREAV